MQTAIYFIIECWTAFHVSRLCIQLVLRSVCRTKKFRAETESVWERCRWTFGPMYVGVEFRNESLAAHALAPNSAILHTTLKAWFSLGIFIMLLGNVVTPPMLIFNLVRSIQSMMVMIPQGSAENDDRVSAELRSSPSSSSSASAKLVSPVIPGMNFPWQHCITFWLVTFLVVLVHEYGHAFAAMNERLNIEGYGAFLSFIFPGAFVRIEDSVSFLPAHRQLRVYCAGVWHNVAFALLCLWMSFASHVALHCSYLTKVSGAVVVSVPANSLLAGSLSIGDVIVDVNGSPVHDVDGFTQSVLRLNTRHLEETNRIAALSKLFYQQTSNALSALLASQTTSEHPLAKQIQQQHYNHNSASSLLRVKDINIEGSGICAAIGESDENISLLDPPLCCKPYFTTSSSLYKNHSMSRQEDKSSASVAATAATDKRCFVHMYSHSRAPPLFSTSGAKEKGEKEYKEGVHNEESLVEKEEVEQGAALHCMSPEDVYVKAPPPAANDVLLGGGGGGGIGNKVAASPQHLDLSRDEQFAVCHTDTDCEEPTSIHSQSRRRVCIRPITTRPERILRIGLRGGGFVVFEGWPIQLLQPDTILLGDYELLTNSVDYYHDHSSRSSNGATTSSTTGSGSSTTIVTDPSTAGERGGGRGRRRNLISVVGIADGTTGGRAGRNTQEARRGATGESHANMRGGADPSRSAITDTTVAADSPSTGSIMGDGGRHISGTGRKLQSFGKEDNRNRVGAKGLRGPVDRGGAAGERQKKSQGAQSYSTKQWWKTHPGFHSVLLGAPGYSKFFLQLCIQLNLSVALVNVIPAYTLDGGHAFVQFFKLLGLRHLIWLSQAIVTITSILLVANIAVSLLQPVWDNLTGMGGFIYNHQWSIFSDTASAIPREALY